MLKDLPERIFPRITGKFMVMSDHAVQHEGDHTQPDERHDQNSYKYCVIEHHSYALFYAGNENYVNGITHISQINVLYTRHILAASDHAQLTRQMAVCYAQAQRG